MKSFIMLAAAVTTVIAISAAAGAVRANEMAGKAAEAAHAKAQDDAVTVATLGEISAAELQVLIDNAPELVLIDARSATHYAAGHIPGAILMRPDDITAEALAEHAESTDAPLVFYCGNRQCPASTKAAHKAAEFGYTRLYKYTDGIEDWQAKGLPLATQ